MPRSTRRFVVRAGLAAGGTLVGALTVRKLATAPPAGPGRPALQDLAGLHTVPPTRLAPYAWQVARPGGSGRGSLADHAGHGVLLNLWATWCGPCVREMPSLSRLAAIVATDGIAVLPVSIDQGGAAPVRAFYRAHGISNLPVLLDPDSDAMSALGIGGIPVSFLVGADGLPRARMDGAADWSTPDAVALVRRLIGR